MKVKKIIIKIVLAIIFILCIMQNVIFAIENKNASVSYTTHVQNIGWQSYVKDGTISGTSGKSLRLEGIKIKLTNMPVEGGIQYRTHVQNIGWQDWVSNDTMAGTSGKSLRLEAIKIKLTGNAANNYDIYYRVHSQNFGWLGWAKNGESAGTQGYSYRLEAIQIKLVAKNGQAPGSTANPFIIRPTEIKYTCHVQNIGWQTYVKDGASAGTSGKGLRLEGIKIKLDNKETAGNVEYSTHIQNIGWQDWVKNDEISGTLGQSLRLEAIRIKLTGEISKKYDIYYRVHAQNFGWLGWAKNGERAGTQGYSYRLEAVEIKLVKKGESITNKVVAFKEKGVSDKLSNPIQGIDVSNWQGDINWKEAKASGIEFAMIRVGFRGYGKSDDGVDGKLVKDERFDTNIQNAIVANIPVGVYFFSQAKTEKEAIEEAQFVLNIIKDYKITYPVAIDTEYATSSHSGRADSLTKDERTKIVAKFCETIKKAGYIPMVYTGKNFAMNNLDTEILSKYDFWIAHYTGANQDNPEENKTDYSGNYTIWQYTSEGTVNGVQTTVDRNLCYKNY